MTADDSRAATGRWLNTPNYLTIDVRPLTAVRGGTPEPDRNTPPPFQTEKPYRLPEIQTAKLPNGLEVLVLERHDLPKVAGRIQFRAGMLASPADKPALMVLAAAAGEGTITRKEEDINRELADLGVRFGGDADLNAQDFHFEVLRKNLEPAFRILTESMLHVDYPAWSVEARKKIWLDEIEKPEAGLDNYWRELFAAAFGPNHPLGRGLGMIASFL